MKRASRATRLIVVFCLVFSLSVPVRANMTPAPAPPDIAFFELLSNWLRYSMYKYERDGLLAFGTPLLWGTVASAGWLTSGLLKMNGQRLAYESFWELLRRQGQTLGSNEKKVLEARLQSVGLKKRFHKYQVAHEAFSAHLQHIIFNAENVHLSGRNLQIRKKRTRRKIKKAIREWEEKGTLTLLNEWLASEEGKLFTDAYGQWVRELNRRQRTLDETAEKVAEGFTRFVNKLKEDFGELMATDRAVDEKFGNRPKNVAKLAEHFSADNVNILRREKLNSRRVHLYADKDKPGLLELHLTQEEIDDAREDLEARKAKQLHQPVRLGDTENVDPAYTSLQEIAGKEAGDTHRLHPNHLQQHAAKTCKPYFDALSDVKEKLVPIADTKATRYFNPFAKFGDKGRQRFSPIKYSAPAFVLVGGTTLGTSIYSWHSGKGGILGDRRQDAVNAEIEMGQKTSLGNQLEESSENRDEDILRFHEAVDSVVKDHERDFIDYINERRKKEGSSELTFSKASKRANPELQYFSSKTLHPFRKKERIHLNTVDSINAINHNDQWVDMKVLMTDVTAKDEPKKLDRLTTFLLDFYAELFRRSTSQMRTKGVIIPDDWIAEYVPRLIHPTLEKLPEMTTEEEEEMEELEEREAKKDLVVIEPLASPLGGP